jgi:hypothetical protein
MPDDRKFIVTYPDGLEVVYNESALMPGFDETFHPEENSDG